MAGRLSEEILHKSPIWFSKDFGISCCESQVWRTECQAAIAIPARWRCHPYSMLGGKSCKRPHFEEIIAILEMHRAGLMREF
ncbi:hypothetical protein HPP92_003824 [Vanilla planifolia]|uniref:Uncharacterized protein n=1 Tax=Vanilla planifolia TaxID=51239 RepID=A0A835VJA6_VANPL|nr:hypothetical protein HPP92_003824 [Vanilla planifolia]